MEEALRNPYVRAALDMIAEAEVGKDAYAAGQGYDALFGAGRMSDFSAHPNVAGTYTDLRGKQQKSTAAGRYQILKSTADDLAKRYNISGFSPEAQDRMAIALMMDTGALDPLMRGDFDAALPKLAQRWAALPSSSLAKGRHGTRTSDFAYTAYNTALKRWANGQDVKYPTLPGGATQPAPMARPMPKVSVGPIPAYNRSSVRDALNARYNRRRPLAIAPGPLTPDTFAALDSVLRAPTPLTPRHTYPSYHIDEPTLVQQPNVDRTSTGVEIIPQQAPAPVAVGPLDTPEFLLAPPQQMAAAPTQFQTLPMDANGNVIQPKGTSFEQGMADLLADPRNIVPVAAAPAQPTPLEYLENELRRTNAFGTADFLHVDALNSPYKNELLALIDAVPVTALG